MFSCSLVGNATFQRQLKQKQVVNNTPAINFGKFFCVEIRKIITRLLSCFFSLVDRLPIEKTCRLQTSKASWQQLNLGELFRGPNFALGYCTGQCVRRGLSFKNNDAYTNYDVFLRNLISVKNPEKKFPFDVQSSCVPVRFKDLKVGVKNRNNKLLKIKILKNAIVTECGCR